MATSSIELAELTSRPTALLVEDDPDALKYRSKLLEASGFMALGVSGPDEALREFRAVPAIDLVLTDIHLKPKIRRDMSGLRVAKEIRRIDKKIPIVGYSAFFSEGDLPKHELKIFDQYFPKGAGHDKILADVGVWKDLAEAYRTARSQWAASKLAEFRQQFPVGKSEFSLLRRLVPDQTADAEEDSIDDILRKAGFRLRLIEPGTRRPRVDAGEGKMISPVAVWLRTEAKAVVAEVYGYPELYSYGDDDEEAIRNILLLMDGFYEEFKRSGDEEHELSIVTNRLKSFLIHVFG